MGASPPPLPNLATGLKGVLFDIDGTLVDSDPKHYEAFELLMPERGLKTFGNGEALTREYYDKHISGGHNDVLGPVLFPDWSPEDQATFFAEKEERFRQLAGRGIERVPGLTEWLAWMDRRGIRRVAVTNAPRANAEAMLGGLGLTGAFEAVCLGEDYARPKPHPDPYLDGLARLGLGPHEALVLEDSLSGIRAGVAAGIPVVGVATSLPAARLLGAGCSWTIRDYHELLQRAQREEAAAGAQ